MLSERRTGSRMASVRHVVDGYHAGSFVPEGARYALWRHYADAYAERDLYAHIGQAIHQNTTLRRFLQGDSVLPPPAAVWFAPIPFPVGRGTALKIRTLQTGSRTFSLPGVYARALGFPDRVLLDLAKAGWGDGAVELRPEVKGAATMFSRTKLTRPSRASLARLLPADVPERWLDAFEADPDPLFVSLNSYEGRPLGGQRADLGYYAVSISESLLGCSPIKVAPTLECVLCPPDYRDWVARVTRALNPAAAREADYAPELSTELRLTPGNVRAAYFDTTESSPELVELCGLVSTDADVLADTYDRMVVDAGHYLDELCEKTVFRSDLECFTWPKFGDIQVVFQRDRYGHPAYAGEYKSAKSAAWYIAKDEVVVGGVGLVHVDLESIVLNFPSSNEDELSWHHDLYVLNVLRDHLCVLAKFDFACQLRLATAGGVADPAKELADAFGRASRALVAASMGSPNYRLERGQVGMMIELRYPKLGTKSRHWYSTRALGGERYVTAT
jgi:hypothetical protein